MAEQPLGVGVSAAVKVGDTVRRRFGSWTPAVHALLEHLGRAGFDAAPLPLGTDDSGRAVLTFLPGDAHFGWPEPMPKWIFDDDLTLVGAAKLLRRCHDLQVGFTPPADARWRIVAPVAPEVICHNDWAPYNALFDGHRPIAMLDWDNAGPGSRLWDAAWSAYQWVSLDPTQEDGDRWFVPLPGRASRLLTFCSAYGGLEPAAVLRQLVELLPWFADFVQREADGGDPGFQKLVSWNVPSRARTNAALLDEQKQLLL